MVDEHENATATPEDGPEAPEAQETAPAATAHLTYVVKPFTLWHDGVKYTRGDEFWTDNKADMDALIKDRSVILAVEARGVEAVAQQIAEHEARIAALVAENESLKAQLRAKRR